MPEYTLLCLCPKDHLMATGYHHARNTLTFTMIPMKIVTTISLIKEILKIKSHCSYGFPVLCVQFLPKLEHYVILSALTNYRKNPRRRLGDHGACPCARQVWCPQQLRSSEIAVLCLPSKTYKGISFTGQLPCLGSCCLVENIFRFAAYFWSKPKSLLWKNKSAKWKLDLYPDLLWFLKKFGPFRFLIWIKSIQ